MDKTKNVELRRVGLLCEIHEASKVFSEAGPYARS